MDKGSESYYGQNQKESYDQASQEGEPKVGGGNGLVENSAADKVNSGQTAFTLKEEV